MKDRPSTIPEDRALTAEERRFIEWLLSHGNARARSFVPQLSNAWVVGKCSCGCASINLSIGGVSHYGKTGMEPLCEYQWRSPDGALFGVFAYACKDLLAGTDLWSIDGRETASLLPPVEALEPV
jgi:hypothetical protein